MVHAKLSAFVQNRKSGLVLWLILAALVILFRLPSLVEPLDQDSAANAYGARLIVQGEPLYTTYHPSHHFPLVYYTYALAFAIFGDRPFAVKFFLMLWMIPTAYLLFRLARHFVGEAGSWLAVVLFLLLTSERWLKGTTAEIELFANLPRIGATLWLLILLKRQAPNWQFGLIGLLGAMSVLFKIVYVSPLVLAAVMLGLEFWPQRHVAGAAARLALRLGWMAAGFVAGWLPVIIYFGALNLLPRLALVLVLGEVHVGDSSGGNSGNPLFLVLYPLIGLGMSNLPLLILGLAGAGSMLRERSMPSLQRAILPLWLVLSWIEAGIGLKLYLHYYLLIVPPLSLLAAWLLARLGSISNLRVDAGKLEKLLGSWPKIVVPAALVLAICVAYGYRNGGYLAHYVRYATGQESYRDFVLNGWPYDGPTLIALQDLADYMQAHSTPDDRIYVWSDDVQLYYLADRRCAVDIIWADRLETPVMPGGLAGTQRRLLAPTTKFIVVAWDNPPDWLRQGLAEHYELTQVIAGREVYQRTAGD
jgi:4-amino-4-deoxy-L-arabinose transferase-like glycosyltransferase